MLLTLLVILLPILHAAIIMKWLTFGGSNVQPEYGSVYPASEVLFDKVIVGRAAVGLPRICNVEITATGQTGSREVFVCDATQNAVIRMYQTSKGWQEEIILADVIAPAHCTPLDIDLDGDLDFVVAVLGNIEPDDGVIGRVVLLINEDGTFHAKTILEDVRRVADVQAADFDNDGDVDLTVAVFGYNRGQVLWLENNGQNHFAEHELLSAPGVINVPIADFDGDGDPDIAAIVSQDEEELWAFENMGDRHFKLRKLWFTSNFDLGSAGLIRTDLDQDGDIDLLLPAGDNLEDSDPFPQPYHGCYWFENTGQWQFQVHRIANLGGTYAAAAGDLDGDNDTDVVLVSMANTWDEPDRASVVWLENDGRQNFRPWQVDSSPTHLVTVDIGDIDGDGRNDIVAGGLHIRGPYDRIGRVTAWLNRGKDHQ